jgi:hypothetical protein
MHARHSHKFIQNDAFLALTGLQVARMLHLDKIPSTFLAHRVVSLFVHDAQRNTIYEATYLPLVTIIMSQCATKLCAGAQVVKAAPGAVVLYGTGTPEG